MKKTNSQEKSKDRFLYIAVDIVSYIVAGALFGFYMDYTFKTTPWFMIASITIGLGIAMYTSYKTIIDN